MMAPVVWKLQVARTPRTAYGTHTISKATNLENMGENHGVSSPASIVDMGQVFATFIPCQGARQPSHLAFFVISVVCQGTQGGVSILEAWAQGLGDGGTTAKRLGIGSSHYGGTGLYCELECDDLYYW
jgi:hypothetical protein